MDLILFLVDERGSVDRKRKAELVRSTHDEVQLQIEKNNEHYASQDNKLWISVTIEPRDWVHMRKEHFPPERMSKLQLRRDGLFEVLEKFNDNAHKLDLLGEYNISSTFIVFDLSLFHSQWRI